MINLDIKKLEKKRDYLILNEDNIIIGFSTAEENRSFNRNTEEGIKELDGIKNEFNVKELAYLKQIHSDTVYVFDGQESFNDNEGDGIITNKLDTCIGVFTADCVPIILIDKTLGVVGAVHSGWKGTISGIVKKALEGMKEKFNCKAENIKIYIGPHIRKCCYEISEELKERFLKETGIEEKELFAGRNLSMEKVIEKDCLDFGVKEDNIFSLNLCTYCTEDIKLHSYRKSDGSYGRLFTFVIIK